LLQPSDPRVAVIGHPILPEQTQSNLTATTDESNLSPGDFERASGFEVVGIHSCAE
jgi:hypothetical protein